MNQTYQFIKMMAHILQHTTYQPKWHYQKEAFQETDCLHDLVYRPPMLCHVNPFSLQALFHQFAQEWQLHGMLVVKHGACIFENYVPPYKKAYRHVSYSMCKTVAGMAAILALDDKKLGLDTRLSDIFPEYTNAKTHPDIKNITIYHLLTMQAGTTFYELSQTFSENWVRDYMQANAQFAPGTDFLYNSMHSYMLCAAVARVYQMDVMQLIRQRLLHPMDIYDITWDTCPKGIVKGGYGMKLSLQDMAKLGLLYLNGGTHYDARTGKAHQLLSPHYVHMATSVQSKTKNPGFDYGFQCWIMEDGYLFNGMLGQNVLIFPAKDMLIATQAGSACFLPDTAMLHAIRNAVYGKPLPIKRSRSATRFPTAKQDKTLPPLLDRTYVFESGIPPILPFFMQLVYQQLLPDIYRVQCFRQFPNTDCARQAAPLHLCIALDDGHTTYVLHAVCGTAIEQCIKIGENNYPVSVTCTCHGDTMRLQIDYLEEANARIYEFTKSGNRLHVKTSELPALSFFADSVLKKEQLPQNFSRMYAHIPGSVKERIQKMLKPDTYGFEK